MTLFSLKPLQRLASFAALLLLLAIAMGTMAPITSAQDNNETLQLWEPPTTGVTRPGPINLVSSGLQHAGVLPITIKIEAVGVDAPVEQSGIIDGVMQNPSGPFVVAWYKETAELGQLGNVVMSGHLDYWDVGQAVFYNVGDLQQGDKIVVTGKDGGKYTYEIDWVENYTMLDLTPDQVNDIVDPGDTEELITLITCGGPFDYASGEYLERTIIRGHRAGAV